MTNRCIMLFPEFENMHVIDRIREQYDPVAKHVRPHITLVFPFESDISAHDLQRHVADAAKGIPPFEIELGGIMPAPDRYLFLNVRKGAAQITALHEKLYGGLLRPFYPDWLQSLTYLPHMTVGHLQDDAELEEVAKKLASVADRFKAIVRTVQVEIIAENADSVVEISVPLG